MQALFRKIGGKTQLINILLKIVPSGGRPYCEPYAGAAALFWSRVPAPIEVLNDNDKNIYNLYCVLRDKELREKFVEKLYLTPYSRQFFIDAIDILNNSNADSVDKAWAYYYISNSSFGSIVVNVTPGRWGRSIKENQANCECIKERILYYRDNGIMEELKRYYKYTTNIEEIWGHNYVNS